MNAPSSSRSSSTSPTILLIDDNKLGLAARKAVLEELGYQITTASSPIDGLKRFAAGNFDLVVTDFKMPRMNGVELIAKAKALKPDTPIILLSGFADALGFDESNTGADIVIQKSANEVNHMIRGVRRLLRKTAPKKPAKRAGGARNSKRARG
ncbi:MAG: response regulator [bacterium]|nr:response regulator [bacterium]